MAAGPGEKTPKFTEEGTEIVAGLLTGKVVLLGCTSLEVSMADFWSSDLMAVFGTGEVGFPRTKFLAQSPACFLKCHLQIYT